MLSDIARISDMLGETLIYFRDGTSAEAEQRVDHAEPSADRLRRIRRCRPCRHL